MSNIKSKYGKLNIDEVSVRIVPLDKTKTTRLDSHVIQFGLIRNGHARLTSNELDYNQCESLLEEIMEWNKPECDSNHSILAMVDIKKCPACGGNTY